MGLPTINLDDRTFQAIVDEAKRRIQHTCPEWTDHNVSDPGVTLIELFAWMTEMILYRLNQVPDKHHIKLMELLGIKLQEPAAAQTEVTFYLSGPRPDEFLIPAGTEVATRRTETQQAVVFSTSETLTIRPTSLWAMVSETTDPTDDVPAYVPHNLRDLETRHAEAFHSKPRVGDALCFGFQEDLSQHVVQLNLSCRENLSLGIEHENPPWQWEVSNNEAKKEGGWLPAVVDSDTTLGLNTTGAIRLRLPHMTQHQLEQDGDPAYWLRCRVIRSEAGENQYDASPQITQPAAESWGGTVKASHAATVYGELLGRSDGAPGQVFNLEYTPVLERRSGETVEVREPESGIWEAWQEVSNFADTGRDDRHFTCDGISGEIRFGPTLRQPDGTIRRYGHIPPRGAEVRFSHYRYGGGASGNVQRNTLEVPKTAIPYVDRVTNHHPAKGGLDAETIDQAKLRARKTLSTQGRAVTPADYEFLAQEADKSIRRVRCLPARTASTNGAVPDGHIQVLLVPEVHQPNGRIDPKELEPKSQLIKRVQEHLDEHRLLTVRVSVDQPVYIEAAVELSLIARPSADPLTLQTEAEARLYKFLNPINGGLSEQGWPFGRDLYPSDIYTCLRDLDGCELIESISFLQSNSSDNESASSNCIRVPPDGLLISGEHQVTVKYAGDV